MKRKERDLKLQEALRRYSTEDVSLIQLGQELSLAPTTISQYLKRNSINVHPCMYNRENKLEAALRELQICSVEDVSKEYGIAEQVLLMANEGLTAHQLKAKVIQMAVDEYVQSADIQKNINRISAKYGINRKTLKRYLDQQGIPIVNNGTKPDFRSDAFKVIDSEEKAYWLGFLYADGYLTARNHMVGLSISIKDIEHLRKYNRFLGYGKGLNVFDCHGFSGNEESRQKVCTMVSTVIQSQELWNDLYDKGCVPNKSLILTFPNESIFSDRKLIYDFIRGYVDGDGTIGVYPHSKSNPNLEASLLIVGTKSFLQGVQRYLIPGFLMQKTNCNECTYRLGYHTRKAQYVADLLYKNATIYLDRKYDTYINKVAPLKSGKNGEG